MGSRLAGNRFSRASALPCQSFEGKRTIVNEDEPRMDTKTDEPPSGTGGTKMLLRYCVLGVTMSWDECPLGARASRPHKARHSLGHLPLLVSFFVALHGPLSSLFQPLKVPSRTPFPTFGGSLLSLLQPLRGPSPFFVALRGYLFAFSWKSFLPLAILGRSLLSLLQPLRGPSSSFVPLRGYLFLSFADNAQVFQRKPLPAAGSWICVSIHLVLPRPSTPRP